MLERCQWPDVLLQVSGVRLLTAGNSGRSAVTMTMP